MRIKWDPRYAKFAYYTIVIIFLSLTFYKLIDNVGSIFTNVSYYLSVFKRIMTPFIIAFCISYLINPAVGWIENNVFKTLDKYKRAKRFKRTLSILSIYFFVMGGLYLLILVMVPQISQSIGDLVHAFPEHIENTEAFIEDIVNKNEYLRAYKFVDSIEENINKVLTSGNEILKRVLNDVLRSAVVFTNTILNIVLALVISYYLLKDKEGFVEASKRLVMAIFSKEKAKGIINFVGETNQVFSRFIIGKFIDSVIIAIICFIGLLVLEIKYPLLISLIIGVTNMIPYFGPFIGAIPSGAIILLDNPLHVVWFAIFIFILQQFDGMYLGPKILGSKVGVSPFWIIFSIVVGGGFFGVVGMFLGVPAVAVIRAITLRFIDRRIATKYVESDILEE